MIKYRIDFGYHDAYAKIEEVEVERESKSSVWINGRRNAKRSDYHNYFDTWLDAKQAIVNRQESRCASLRRQLEVSNSVLGNINGLKPPTTSE
jgi:hypothetical protein